MCECFVYCLCVWVCVWMYTYMGIVLTGGVRCSKCDANSRESFRKLLLLAVSAEADGGTYFTISILLNMYVSRTMVCSAQLQQQRQLRWRRRRQQQPHIRARVWIMIISIILYGLVLYDVLFVSVRVQSLVEYWAHTHTPTHWFAAAAAAILLLSGSELISCPVSVYESF